MMSATIRETRVLGDHLVTCLEGEIDLANAADLADELVEAVQGTAAGLVLDLSEVTYLDSSGIRMLFEVIRRLEARRQRVAIAVAEESPMRSLLKVASVHEAVPVLGTAEGCVAALSLGEAGKGG